jgi:hypothetical protein
MDGVPNPTSSGSAGGGGIKPESSKKMEDHGFDTESDLTEGKDTENPEAGPTRTQKIGEKAKNAAANASETVQDIKDIATAGPTGLESSGKEVKQGYEKAGVKGAAGAATREAAGAAAEAAVDVISAGTLAEFGGKIQKGVSKALKKENLQKIGIILSVPLILLVFVVVLIIYYIKNPLKLAWKIVWDVIVKRFIVQVATGPIRYIISEEDTLKKYGYVEYKPGTAIAAPTVTFTAKPGSLEDKLSKIDFSKAKYQSDNGPRCPYEIKTKELINPQTGNKISVIDKLIDVNNKEADLNSFEARYCIANSMPLYNMMIRTQQARDTNKYSGLELNYMDSKKSSNLEGKSKDEIKKYVYNKTVDRVASKADADTKVSVKDIQDYTDKVRESLVKGEDPNKVAVPWDVSPDSQEARIKTLCTFSQAYLTGDNLKKGIFARLNSGQRLAGKYGTGSSTADLNQANNAELSSTFDQMQGWSSSVTYSQNVYGTQDGVKPDPERLGNASYGASYSSTLAILLNIGDKCAVYTGSGAVNSFLNFFTNRQQDAYDTINADYKALQIVIADQSNGVFSKPSDVGLDQLMTGVITMGSGTAISGVEAYKNPGKGSQNYINQSQGISSLNNQYMMRMGGRFLTNSEANKINTLAENTRRNIDKKNGIAYRLFDNNNISSLKNIVIAQTPMNKYEFGIRGKEYIAKLANPIKLIADVQSSINYFALGDRNIAYAADNSGNAYYKLDTVGIPEEDLANVDQIKNSNEIQDILENGTDAQKKVLGYFDKCSKANIPSKNIFARQYTVAINEDDVAQVNKNNPIKENFEGISIPKYPTVNDVTKLGFSDKREFLACEIYLLPKNPATQKDLYPIQNQLFGFEITGLAKKYQIYLYSNSIADLMVQLSNTEKTESIYANGSTAATDTGGTGSQPIIGGDTSNLTCAAGTDEGIGDGYKEGKLYKIRLCRVQGIVVNAQIASNVDSMLNAARSSGINLGGGGFRTMQGQIDARKRNNCPDIYNAPAKSCSPPTARPGYSNHQMGLAIDITYRGGTIPDHSSPAWIWLNQNASKYGLFNLPSEPWHWSVDAK